MSSDVTEDVMGTETRIGIVTGLVIVVIASIYFFYGKESPRDDFMLATDSKAASPPKIPPTTEQKAQLAQQQGRRSMDRSPVGPPIARKTPPRQLDHRPGLPQAATEQERLARQRVRSVPPASIPSAASPSSPAAQPQHLEATKLASAAEEAGATTPAPVNLRTAPSQNLIDATQENVETGPMGPLSPDRDLASLTDRRAAGAASPSSSTRAGDARQNPLPVASPAKPAERPIGQAVASAPEVSEATLPDWPKKHRITEGDTFVGLAERYYKSAARADAIIKANPQIRDPRRLRIGEEVTIPPPAWEQDVRPQATVQKPGSGGADQPAERAAEASSQKQMPPQPYRVREGDTFYSIAQSLYGSGSRWQEIYDLNRDLVRGDPRKLRPGMVINLPE